MSDPSAPLIQDILTGFASALGGAIAGAAAGVWLAHRKDKEKSRKDNTIRLYELYLSKEYHKARANAWIIYGIWKNADKAELIKWFTDEIHPSSLDKYKANFTDLDRILHFWALVMVYIEDESINEELFKKMLYYFLTYFETFFDELAKLYQETKTQGAFSRHDPLWVEKVPKLIKRWKGDQDQRPAAAY